MTKNNDFVNEEEKSENEYDEVVKKKLDQIIEQTSIENSALKKILESLNEKEKEININKNKKK